MDTHQILSALVSAQPGARLQIDWQQFGALITAIGALGVASFGVVESLGKALTIGFPGRSPRIGLPYAGFHIVERMTRPLRPALECAYGKDFLQIIAQQYRADRSSGRAPDTIREGVKLGLPFLGVERATQVIASVWDMDRRHAENLARALQSEATPPPSHPAGPAAAAETPPTEPDGAQLLAGRFATALDQRVNAAFSLAEEQYEAYAKTWAGVTAVVLALVFNLSIQPRFSWLTAGLIGLVAVPLAPVAKDLSTSLQNALTAFKSIPTRRV